MCIQRRSSAFLNERPIFDAVYHGVKTALNQWDSPNVMKLERPAPAPSRKQVPQSSFLCGWLSRWLKRLHRWSRLCEAVHTPKPAVPAPKIQPAEPLPGLSVNDSGVPSGLTRTLAQTCVLWMLQDRKTKKLLL